MSMKLEGSSVAHNTSWAPAWDGVSYQDHPPNDGTIASESLDKLKNEEVTGNFGIYLAIFLFCSLVAMVPIGLVVYKRKLALEESRRRNHATIDFDKHSTIHTTVE